MINTSGAGRRLDGCVSDNSGSCGRVHWLWNRACVNLPNIDRIPIYSNIMIISRLIHRTRSNGIAVIFPFDP